LATLAVFFANGLGIGAWASSIPTFQARLALSDGALSLALLAFAVGAVLAMPMMGLVAPRIGTGRAARLGATFYAAALPLPFPAITLSGSLVGLAGAAFLIGAASGAFDVAMNARASDIERRWGAAIMSSFHAGYSGGGLAGAALGLMLASMGVAPAWTMDIAALLAAALAACAWNALARDETVATPAGLALPGRAAVVLGGAALLCMMCEGAMADWSGVYLITVARAVPSVVAAGYAAFSAAMVAGRLFGDGVVRSLGSVRVVRIGGAMAAAGLTLAVAVPSPVIAVVGFGLVGVGLSNVVPVIFSAAGRLATSPATGIAMAATIGYTGFLAGPPLIGAIASAAGLRAGITLLAVGAAVVALLAVTLDSRRS
jgi:fucose permease